MPVQHPLVPFELFTVGLRIWQQGSSRRLAGNSKGLGTACYQNYSTAASPSQLLTSKYETCRGSHGQNYLTALPFRDLLTLLRSVNIFRKELVIN